MTDIAETVEELRAGRDQYAALYIDRVRQLNEANTKIAMLEARLSLPAPDDMPTKSGNLYTSAEYVKSDDAGLVERYRDIIVHYLDRDAGEPNYPKFVSDATEAAKAIAALTAG